MDFLKIVGLVFVCSHVCELAEGMRGVKSHGVQEGEWTPQSAVPFRGDREGVIPRLSHVIPEVLDPTPCHPGQASIEAMIRDPFRGRSLPLSTQGQSPSFWQSTKEVGWKVFKGLTAFLAVSHSLKMASAQMHVWDNTTACAPFLVNPTALCLDGSMPQMVGQLLCDNVLIGGCQDNLGIFTNATGPSCAENETLSLEGFEDEIALYCNDQRQLQRPCLQEIVPASTEIQVILKDGRQFLQCLLGGESVNIPASLTCPGGGIFACSGHAAYQIMHRCPDKGDLCHTHAAKSDTTGGVESGAGGGSGGARFDGRFNGTCSCIPAVWDFSSPCAPQSDPGSINTTSIPLEALCKDGSKPTLHGQLLCDGVVAGTCPQAGDFGTFTPENTVPRTFCTADETASIGWGTNQYLVALYCTDQHDVTTRITSTQCAPFLSHDPLSLAYLSRHENKTSLSCTNNKGRICNPDICWPPADFPANMRTYCTSDERAIIVQDGDFAMKLVCVKSGKTVALEATKCTTCCRNAPFTLMFSPHLIAIADKIYLACDDDTKSQYSAFQKNLPIMAVPQPIFLSCEDADSTCLYTGVKTHRVIQRCGECV